MWEFENNIYFIFPHKNAGIYLFIYYLFILFTVDMQF